MRLKTPFVGVVAFLLGLCGRSLGMGSGPHPHLLIAISPSTPPSPSDSANGVFLMLLVAFLSILVYFARRKRISDSITGIPPNT